MKEKKGDSMMCNSFTREMTSSVKVKVEKNSVFCSNTYSYVC